ncbi:thioesterase family protein [Demetria terragena]|uniref:thioesterase family protein n=1 Tax=Demetria terragena TaxID=63959 RepID=UPI0003814B55|nr:thioesterase family protein [Demetria terragena]
MSEFDEALALRDGEFPGSYAVDISEGWTIGGGINGGLLLAVMAKALSQAVGASGHSAPLALSAYYLTPTRPGPAMVETDIAREGGTTSIGSAALVQYDEVGRREERIRVTGSFTDHDKLPHEATSRLSPPNLPPLEDCVGHEMAPDAMPNAPLLERTDVRFDPESVGWAMGKPSGRGLIQAYLRLADGHEPDPFVLLFACDALPPVSFDMGLPGWAPTIEFTVHVVARPAPGWLRVKHYSEHTAAGHFVEDCEVWDSTDTLVAQSRQLARLPRTP